MQSKFVKILALVMASMMLLFAVSCADPEPSGAETTAGDETTAAAGPVVTEGDNGETEEVVEETTYEASELPDDLDYGGDVVSILYWSDVEMPEFEVKEESANAVDNAIYERNLKTAEDLNIEYEWTGTPGNNQKRNEFVAVVKNSFSAGDRAYDIIASYSRTLGNLAANNLVVDLASIEDSYIDLSKPWWPKSLVDTVTINDAMYFISGDISTNMLHFMYGIFSNNDIISELQLDDPIELVKNYEWTLEKFMAMTENVYADLNADGTKSSGDRFGYSAVYYSMDAFFIGSGMCVIEPDEDDGLVLSDDLTSDKIYNFIDTLTPWANSNDTYISRVSKSLGDWENVFADGNVLFIQDRMYLADRKLKDVDFLYSVLPTPMYDQDQGEYYTCVGNPFTLWGIMVDVPDDEQQEFSAVLESLGSYGYRLTTPQIFEVNMKVKYSESDDASMMFDFIREGICHDLARIFTDHVLGCTFYDFITNSIAEGNGWASTYRANQRSVAKKLAELVETISKD